MERTVSKQKEKTTEETKEKVAGLAQTKYSIVTKATLVKSNAGTW